MIATRAVSGGIVAVPLGSFGNKHPSSSAVAVAGEPTGAKRGFGRIGIVGGLVLGLACAALPGAAAAQTTPDMNDQLKQLQHEITKIQRQYQKQLRSLQKQVDDLRAAQAAPRPSPPPRPSASPGLAVVPGPNAPPGLAVPPTAVLPPPVPGGPGAPPLPAPATVTATSGGVFGTGIHVSFANTFIEGASIFRTRNETADISSNFNTGIPMPNNPNYNLSEFRESAHQSRLAMEAYAFVNADTKLRGYVETDFQSAGASTNSVESNSYTLRLRQAYAELDKSDWGIEVVGGQIWSLLTMFKQDMTPGQENIPVTIDGAFVPGFTWTRDPAFRIVQHFGMMSVGLAAESPQAVIFSGPTAPLVPTTFNNPGGTNLNPSTTYSTDLGPDIVGKVTADPGWGHFEAYGVGRAFRSRADFSNHTIIGGGGGLAGIFPVVPQRLDLQADFLAGNGIGRYGVGQLPDIAVQPNGVLAPIPELQVLLGAVGHATPWLDLYTYAGMEKADATDFMADGVPYGYGNPLYNNTGCLHEGSTLCAANTSRLWQVTGGFWWTVYKGNFGKFLIGGQGSFTERQVFPGLGGGPNTNEGIFLASLRYYPFAP